MNIERRETRALVQDALCCEHCLLWVSLPCTGGSAWNKWNYANVPQTREGIDRKIKWLFSQLPDIVRIIDVVKAQGFDPIVLMELPHSCLYWATKEMNDMLTKFDMRTVVTDGCAFGLKAKFGKHAGLPIKKPW